MRPLDLLLYLFGNRRAIEHVAGTRYAWVIGAILVLTAGIARNYDHLDLMREPEWFIGPFAASIISTLFIYFCVSSALQLDKVGEKGQLKVFLTLVWLTAPCAWIYGIPVESFTNIVTATKWNIGFLAVVSLWRVALMVRAVSVLATVPWVRVLPLILAPAALEMMVGAFYKRLSLVGIMGGVRLPPESELLISATRILQIASFWAFIISSIACFTIRAKAKSPLNRPNEPLRWSILTTAVISLLLWIAAALPWQI